MSVPRPPVFVVEDALVRVRGVAAAAAPNETGGLIVGVTTVDSVWITGFLEIEVPKRHPARFVIPAGATQPAIDRLRVDDPRIGYLGDWHSHPADVGPSAVDFSTLRDLVFGSLGERRLLGLVRRTDAAWEFGLWAVSRLRLPVRAEFERTGPLPPP